MVMVGTAMTPLFQIIEFRLTVGQCKTPAIVVNDDGHVIGISKDAALRSKVASSNLGFFLGFASEGFS